jgi:septum site-determining protein MinC
MSSSAAESKTDTQLADPAPVDLASGSQPPEPSAPRPAAVLKGGPRGLEFLVDGHASNDAIATALCTRLAEAPTFFRGNSVRVRVEDGPLPPGCLARLDDIATRFELHIIEVAAVRSPAKSDSEAGEPLTLASGSTAVPSNSMMAAASSPALTTRPILVPVSTDGSAAASCAEVAAQLPEGDTRIVVGPVRSGVILEHHGNLVVVGDVNPGAEVRAERNIIVLGRLRGIAHAGIGRTFGFILALKLEPQQLRIARQVARAGDADGPVAAAEIAYVTSNKIVVERYAGKLPLGLANSM